jgi:hypothetical protein
MKKIDVTILTAGPGFPGTKFLNPNIKELTKFVDNDGNEDSDGHDFDIWKLDLEFNDSRKLMVLIKSEAATLEDDDYESNELFKDKNFCKKLVKEIFNELERCIWIPDNIKQGKIKNWSFTGDCGLWFDIESNTYGFDT